MKTNFSFNKNKIKSIKNILTFFATIILSINLTNASDSVGTIDSTSGGFKYAKVCQDPICSVFGNVNFKPTIIAGVNPIVINDTNIVGHAWGDQIGWISLNPTGLVGVDVLKVDPITGVITGKAYANSGSWINFSPTGAGVALVDNGSGSNFSGYAWVSGTFGGWMKFDCLGVGTCVKTDWRIVSMRGVVTPPVVTPSAPSFGSLFFGGNVIATPTPNVTESTTTKPDTKPPVTDAETKTPTTPKTNNNTTTNNPELTKPVEEPFIPVPPFPLTEEKKGDNTQPITKEEKYKQVFPVLENNFGGKNCWFCVVVRDDSEIVADNQGNIKVINDRKIMKYGLVPTLMELPISIKLISANSPDVDAVSATGTIIAAWAIRRYVIIALIRKLFVGV